MRHDLQNEATRRAVQRVAELNARAQRNPPQPSIDLTVELRDDEIPSDQASWVPRHPANRRDSAARGRKGYRRRRRRTIKKRKNKSY